MASIHGFGRRKQTRESPISFVQIDGLVILKIIKHCHEEGSGSGEVQGVLLGLVVDKRLEITNCFAFPRNTEEDETDETVEYQCVMMRHLRNVNVDHLHVGWYQTNPYGSQISKLETIDSQYMYQSAIEESVVLFYDPIRTARGFLALKAYRLTNTAMKLCKEGEFTADTLRSNHMSFEKFFEEIPLVIKNSHLINALVCELESETPVDCGKQLLDMGGFGLLEKTMQSHMKCIEEVSKHSNHLRQQTVKQQHVVKENAMRAQRGEPPLTEEEVNKMIKPLAPLQRLESLLNYSQTLNYCQQSASYSTQNISKLFMAKALQSNTTAKQTQDK